MTTKTPSKITVNANYVVNPANGQIKVVVTKTSEKEVKAMPKISYIKTRYSFDSTDGGYTGL